VKAVSSQIVYRKVQISIVQVFHTGLETEPLFCDSFHTNMHSQYIKTQWG